VVGTTINGLYEVEECVGEGAMGRVYRAHHLRLQSRQVALKILLGDLAATMAMRLRFTREAEAASLLSHPNVVPVLDFGKTSEGLLYLAMEYVEGRSLASIIASEAPMAPRRVVDLARQLCLGLSHAHGHGLIHRDFKPDNVLVVEGPGGEIPRIADFGLAIFSDSDDGDQNGARLTSAGTVVGTPIYAAPEQALDHGLDQRVDLFALGVTMYEMLAGRPPFEETSAVEVLHNNLAAPRPRIAARTPGVRVPPGLERIVHQLISSDREQRYPSAHAVIGALDQVELDAPLELDVVVEPTTTLVIAWPARGPRRVGLAAVGGGLLIALVALLLWPRDADRPAPAPSPPAVASAAASEQPAAPAKRAAPVVDQLLGAEAAPPPGRRATQDEVPPGAARRRSLRRGSAVAPARAASEPSVLRARPGDGRVDRVRGDDAPVQQGLAARTGETASVVPAESTAALSSAASIPASSSRSASPSTSTSSAGAPAGRGTGTEPGAEPPVNASADARAVVGGLAVDGSLPDAEVQRAIDRVQARLSGCHRAAAGRAGRPPAGEAAVQVSLTIDEDGRAGRVSASGGNLPGLSACVADVIGAVRSRVAPDVGEVRVSFRVDFVTREER